MRAEIAKAVITMDPLHQDARACLNASGIVGAELIASPSYPPTNFGDSEVIFRIRAILVRFIRDRGQDGLTPKAGQVIIVVLLVV